MLTYIVNIKASLVSFFQTNKGLSIQSAINKNTSEPLYAPPPRSNVTIDARLRQKCDKAVRELSYIKQFKHWPISELKDKK